MELCIKDWPELWSQLDVVLIHPCQVILPTFQEQMRMGEIMSCVWVFKGQYGLWKQLFIVGMRLVLLPIHRPSDKEKKQYAPGRNAEQVLVQKLLVSIRRVLKGLGDSDLSHSGPSSSPHSLIDTF